MRVSRRGRERGAQSKFGLTSAKGSFFISQICEKPDERKTTPVITTMADFSAYPRQTEISVGVVLTDGVTTSRNLDP